MPIQAIIMAGGEGTRLRPMTLNRPKPLVPILGKPCMHYAMKLLEAHHISSVAATLWYMPTAIKDIFGDTLVYYEETIPVGTAGSVRLAKEELADTFIVLSGDGLTDCDLTDAMRFHLEKGAMATLVLKNMPVPLAYGVVMTNEDGRVNAFVEKPDWTQVFSDQVNTGIYILNKAVLDLVPKDKPYDFGQDLFPKMVKEGMPVYGYVMQGYWCDVGDQVAYMNAQLDMMRGLAKLPIDAKREGQLFLGEGAFVHQDAVIDGLCYIGQGARVERGALIHEGTVIGQNAVVGEGARLERTCLWEGARVHAMASLRGALLCDGSTVHSGVMMEEDTALGSSAEVMSHARLAPGVKIWPRRVVQKDARVYENVVWGDLKQPLITQSACRVESVRDIDMLLGALKETSKAMQVAVMQNGLSSPMALMTIGALTARGVQVLDLGAGTLPNLRKLQAYLHAPMGIFVDGDLFHLTGEDGSDMDKSVQRKLETLMLRQDYAAHTGGFGDRCDLHGAMHLYAALMAEDAELNKDVRAAVFCTNAILRDTVKEIMAMAQCEYVRVADDSDLSIRAGEMGFLITDKGDSLFILTHSGMMDDAAREMLTYWCLVQSGFDVLFLQPDAPRGIISILPAGVRVLSASEKDEERKAYQAQLNIHQDAIAKMLLIMRCIRNRADMDALVDSLPHVFRAEAEVPCPIKEKGRVLRMLGEKSERAELSDGIRVTYEKGYAHMSPFVDRAAFRITAESTDAEFAKELCDLCVRDIAKILQSE